MLAESARSAGVTLSEFIRASAMRRPGFLRTKSTPTDVHRLRPLPREPAARWRGRPTRLQTTELMLGA